MKKKTDKKPGRAIVKYLLLYCGFLFTGLGIIGIFLPIMPTTPFLLLAAACFFRSSDKFYNWLITNRYLGKFIKNYREKKGIPLRAKILAVSMICISIAYSVAIVDSVYLKIILIAIAVAVSIHILHFKTLKE